MSKLQEVPLSAIDFDNKSYIFRHTFNVEDLENSITYEGLLFSPILVKQKDKFVIVAGYRRLTACRKLDKKAIQCVVYEEGELEQDELLKVSIAENTKRKDLKPVEIAEALLRIKNELHLSDEELANQFGETFNIGSNTEIVQKYLRLNLFDEKSKDLLAETPHEEVEFTIADLKEKTDRESLVDIVRQYKDIKKNQLKKIIDNAQKVSAQDKTSLKRVFEEDSLKSILQNENLPGSKKINAFLGELENRANPNRQEMLEKYHKELRSFKAFLEQQNPDYVQKISLKKDNLEDSHLKITLNIRNTKELTEMMKILYEGRKKHLMPLIDL